MEYLQLGRPGLRVSALTLGTMTFGGAGKFANVGTTDLEGADADGRRAERRGPLAPPPDPGLRGEPAPSRDGPHRPLPGARVGRPDSAGGDARGARRPAARGQDPLRGLLELHGLAALQGARRVRA